ncbi:MAG: hypothetical protein D3908_16585 [Candidatus Electrothrix sp. AUS4]|nr:hypothetical protein [Candidatus Electrothrix sp. AUS4]
MHRRKKKFLQPNKNDISWSEIIILSFLTCIAIFLLYSSLNRPAENLVIKDMKGIESAADVQGNNEGRMN